MPSMAGQRANVDMLKLTEHRPAYHNLTVLLCWSKLKICAFTSSNSQGDAKYNKHS